MKHIILSLLIALSCASVLFAQTKPEATRGQCTLQITSAPDLRGFRVGVSQAAVLAAYPGTSMEKPDKFGRSQIRLTVIDTSTMSKVVPRPDKAIQADMTSGDNERAFVVDSARYQSLKGVRRILLGFLDGRISSVEVAYDDSVTWNNVDEFVTTVAKAKSLPENWSIPQDDDSARGRELRCTGFVITANLGADMSDTKIAARLSVEDLAASKTIEKRQDEVKDKAQAAEDAKRKTFKP